MSLDRTLLMVTRLVSVPEYPKRKKCPQNGAALAGAWLEVRCRDGKSPQNPSFLKLGSKLGKLRGRNLCPLKRALEKSCHPSSCPREFAKFLQNIALHGITPGLGTAGFPPEEPLEIQRASPNPATDQNHNEGEKTQC